MQTPRILVTGASGFIGTWVLKQLLGRNLDFLAVDTQPNLPRWQRILGPAATSIPFAPVDLTQPLSVKHVFENHSFTHLIHLAAILTPACQADPVAGCQINVLASTILFDLARQHRLRGLSYASSLAVFGPEPDSDSNSPISPENRPPSFYGAFKKSLELIAEQYWLHFQLPSVGIRPHVVYGPERDQGLTAGPSLAARALALRQPFTINYTGLAGYDYVDDVALAFVRSALETPPAASVVNLPSQPASVEHVRDLLIALAPAARELISISGPAIPPNISPPQPTIANLFPDWTPTPLPTGLKQTLAFYQSPLPPENR